MAQEPEQEHELRYSVHVKTYGHKSKCVTDVGHALCAALWQEFGGRFWITDHRGKVIEFDPDAHNFGIGES